MRVGDSVQLRYCRRQGMIGLIIQKMKYAPGYLDIYPEGVRVWGVLVDGVYQDYTQNQLITVSEGDVSDEIEAHSIAIDVHRKRAAEKHHDARTYDVPVACKTTHCSV